MYLCIFSYHWVKSQVRLIDSVAQFFNILAEFLCSIESGVLKFPSISVVLSVSPLNSDIFCFKYSKAWLLDGYTFVIDLFSWWIGLFSHNEISFSFSSVFYLFCLSWNSSLFMAALSFNLSALSYLLCICMLTHVSQE